MSTWFPQLLCQVPLPPISSVNQQPCLQQLGLSKWLHFCLENGCEILSIYHLDLDFSEKWRCWNLFLHLLAVHVYSSASCLFMLFAYFSIGLCVLPSVLAIMVLSCHGTPGRLGHGAQGFTLLSFIFSLRTCKGKELRQPFLIYHLIWSHPPLKGGLSTYISGWEWGRGWPK